MVVSALMTTQYKQLSRERTGEYLRQVVWKGLFGEGTPELKSKETEGDAMGVGIFMQR